MLNMRTYSLLRNPQFLSNFRVTKIFLAAHQVDQSHFIRKLIYFLLYQVLQKLGTDGMVRADIILLQLIQIALQYRLCLAFLFDIVDNFESQCLKKISF